MIWLAWAACASPYSDLTIDAVDPGSGTTLTAVPVLSIRGSGFTLPVVSSVDDDTSQLGEIVVTIGDTLLEDVVVRDETLIEASVPSGLPAGTHDVTVTLGSRTGVLVGGYVVLEGCVSAGLIDLCAQATPTQPLDVVADELVDTDLDPRCATVAQPDGGPICLLYATEVTIRAGATLTATGSRPLAIAASGAIVVDGTIDVSSHRGGTTGPSANDASCSFAAIPDPDLSDGAGGAGGSLGAPGGAGGDGDTGSYTVSDASSLPGRAGPLVTVAGLRGGCAGQPGASTTTTPAAAGGGGGDSGGALYLRALQRVEILGSVRAAGAGGGGGEALNAAISGGGGGGGSGGLVVIESAQIRVAGEVSANGGGGGQGATTGTYQIVTPLGSALVSFNQPGDPGQDGAGGALPSPGGSVLIPLLGPLGAGGAGGAATAPAGDGVPSVSGGGGGGGGVGIIRLVGPMIEVTGTVSPPASP